MKVIFNFNCLNNLINIFVLVQSDACAPAICSAARPENQLGQWSFRRHRAIKFPRRLDIIFFDIV